MGSMLVISMAYATSEPVAVAATSVARQSRDPAAEGGRATLVQYRPSEERQTRWAESEPPVATSSVVLVEVATEATARATALGGPDEKASDGSLTAF